MSVPPQLVKGSLASGEGVLCVGPPRTGTKSLSEALRILGYSHVHHLSHDFEADVDGTMKLWAEVARANMPWVARRCGVQLAPYDRKKWDSLVGEYQVLTDACASIPGVFVETYPNAKVIMVERDFESWFRSWEKTLFKFSFGPWTDFCYWVLDPLSGNRSTYNARCLMGGYFEANTLEEARENGPRIMKEHYQSVRDKAKPENLLVLQMGHGWEPLCKFLEKPIPNVPYPRENQTKNLEGLIIPIRIIRVFGVVKHLAIKLFPVGLVLLGYLLGRWGRLGGDL